MPYAEYSEAGSARHWAGMPASDLLLAEFIHRSANDFAVACAEVHVASGCASLRTMRNRLETLAARLNALASIQRILQPPREDVLDLGNHLCELCHYHAEARFAEQSAFIHLRTCEIVIDAARGWAFLMVVSELLTNAARHAFREPGGIVRIDVARHDDEIVCLVTDNGAGAPVNGAGPGRGMAIVSELAGRLGLALTARQCAVGTTFELRLPCPRESVSVLDG